MSKAGKQLIAAAKSAVKGIRDMKPEDSREARGGWAPGAYMCICSQCNEHFIGAKRSFSCADCAYS